ncbi:MAG: hypothetical protein K2X38_23575 [Gemmataceae bacterium]|nr:hypothetical protein [Gemmataceae bacterium]
MLRFLLFPLAAVLLTSPMCGCTPVSPPNHEPTLTQLVTYYGRYVGQNKGTPPPNEQALKDFVKKVDANRNLDELMISPRDKQPYVVRYGVKPSMGGKQPVIAHEAVGVGGKKLVGFAAGEVREMNDAEIQASGK